MNLLKTDTAGIVVYPATEADLRSAVRFAFKYGIRVVAQCSGHDFNGRSSGFASMLIKTRKLNSVVYDPASQTVRFGAGANHGDIYGALSAVGRVYVGGQSKTVCPAGCLSGGCHGLLSRQYGLGIDNILSIRFVLYNGTVLTLNSTSHSSLFNAYLGAGANSFGIAVGFTARTFPAPESIWQVRASFNMFNEDVPGHPYYNMLSAFLFNVSYWESLPVYLSGNINLFGPLINFDLIYQGPRNDSATQAALAPLFASPFFNMQSYQAFNWSSQYELAVNNYPPSGEIWQRKVITNMLVPADQNLLNGLGQMIGTAQPYMWLWLVFGGAVRNGTAGSVSPGMRGAMYEVLFGSQWNDPGEDEWRMESVSPFLPASYSAMPYSYPNEYTSWGGTFNPLPDWKTRFYGSRYDALLRVKRTYDPCNMFVAQHSVGWDQPQGTCKGA